VTCAAAPCTATWRYTGAAGWFTLDVQHFDQPNGVAHFQVLVANQVVDDWEPKAVIRPARWTLLPPRAGAFGA
jgi:hypothetical protein